MESYLGVAREEGEKMWHLPFVCRRTGDLEVRPDWGATLMVMGVTKSCVFDAGAWQVDRTLSDGDTNCRVTHPILCSARKTAGLMVATVHRKVACLIGSDECLAGAGA